jgi:hypothetical protein
MNLIDQAKTIMQEKDDIYKLFNRKDNPKVNFVALEYRNEILSAKASQMLIDLTIFKEKLTHLFQNKECPDGDVVAMGLMISAVSPFAKYINSIIEEINSAIEILERK